MRRNFGGRRWLTLNVGASRASFPKVSLKFDKFDKCDAVAGEASSSSITSGDRPRAAVPSSYTPFASPVVSPRAPSPVAADLADSILCTVCGGGDESVGNLIVLCDGLLPPGVPNPGVPHPGVCARDGSLCSGAYHQRCLKKGAQRRLRRQLALAPLAKWFCPVCDAANARAEWRGGDNSGARRVSRVGRCFQVDALPSEGGVESVGLADDTVDDGSDDGVVGVADHWVSKPSEQEQARACVVQCRSTTSTLRVRSLSISSLSLLARPPPHLPSAPPLLPQADLAFLERILSACHDQIISHNGLPPDLGSLPSYIPHPIFNRPPSKIAPPSYMPPNLTHRTPS